jgi:hypothetical protein
LKGERIQKNLDKKDLTTRWKTIQDFCSVIACHSAFEDCMDGDNVGLGGRHVIIYLLSLTIIKREQLAVDSTEYMVCRFLGGIDEGVRSSW